MPSSRSPSSPRHTAPHTYHCLCSTHLLTTPYDIATLPQRRHPSIDQARILPLPSIPPPPTAHNDDNDEIDHDPVNRGTELLPSLLSPNLRLARRPLVVQREDGWEKRRIWRCGRCGLGVGYEVVREEERVGGVEKGDKEVQKVLFLLEGGLVETGRWED